MSAAHGRAQRLARELRDLRGVAQALPDALLLLDDGSHLLWANPAASRLLGIAWPQDRATALLEHFGGSKIATWLQGGGGDEEITSPLDPAIRLRLALMPCGEQRRIVLARDISHIRKLEQVRQDFVANVSHELRTPLTVIHGYLEMLDPEDVPALSGVLNDLRAQSQRMRQIVDDLLVLSRLESGQELARERTPMAPLLETLRQEAEALSHGRHQIRVKADACFDLLGSPKELHSAFSNLVSNAVRYTPDGGTITIGWNPTPRGANYSVSDTGIGIPAKHLSRLTERFYRVSSSRSRDKGGTGLGLSIVKHVLDLHQAYLRIDSTLDEGSIFSCCFGKAQLLPRET